MDGIGWLSQVIGILRAPSVLITWSNVQKYDIDANGRKYYTVKSWETAKKKYCSDLHRKRLVQSKLSWIKVQIAKMHMFNNEKKFSILMKWILLMWNFCFFFSYDFISQFIAIIYVVFSWCYHWHWIRLICRHGVAEVGSLSAKAKMAIKIVV